MWRPKEFPASMAEGLDYSRHLSQSIQCPRAMIERHRFHRPGDRVRLTYPLGVEAGVMETLRQAKVAGIALPWAIHPIDATAAAFARGMGTAAVLPPRVVFDTSPPRAVCGIWHAGFTWGVLRTLELLLEKKR
jgi:hypothetical protein